MHQIYLNVSFEFYLICSYLVYSFKLLKIKLIKNVTVFNRKNTILNLNFVEKSMYCNSIKDFINNYERFDCINLQDLVNLNMFLVQSRKLKSMVSQRLCDSVQNNLEFRNYFVFIIYFYKKFLYYMVKKGLLTLDQSNIN